MALCLNRCGRCDNVVTVLLEAHCDCLSFAMVVEEMMAQNREAGIAIIVRIDGFDISVQCGHRQNHENVDDCLF